MNLDQLEIDINNLNNSLNSALSIMKRFDDEKLKKRILKTMRQELKRFERNLKSE